MARGERENERVNEALLTFWVSKVDYSMPQRPESQHPSLLTFRRSVNKREGVRDLNAQPRERK